MSQNEDKFGVYPINTVVGVLETPAALEAALNDLQAKGLGADDVTLLCGQRGADILDVEGKNHGFIARIVRTVQTLGDEREKLEQLDAHLRQGHFVVTLPVSETHSKENLAETLRQNGGKRIHYVGRLSIEDL